MFVVWVFYVFMFRLKDDERKKIELEEDDVLYCYCVKDVIGCYS